MPWTNLTFSKHRGKTLPQVMFNDPDWFFWACKNKVFKKPILQREANDILEKCQSIKIPNNQSNKYVIEYTFDRRGFCVLEKVPFPQELHHDSFRKDVIDFSVPYGAKSYDKLGYSIFLRRVKYILFGDSSHKMTKQRCETFFSNEDNLEH